MFGRGMPLQGRKAREKQPLAGAVASVALLLVAVGLSLLSGCRGDQATLAKLQTELADAISQVAVTSAGKKSLEDQLQTTQDDLSKCQADLRKASASVASSNCMIVRCPPRPSSSRRVASRR